MAKPHSTLWVRPLAAFMRRMPIEIGRVDWLWRKLYASIGGGGYSDDAGRDARWPADPQSEVRLRYSKLKLSLDVSDWSERRLYFSGNYYQPQIEKLIIALLREGDQYVDVGANIGVTVMAAASRLRRQGRVVAFEPNPVVFKRLERHLEANQLDRVQVFPFALSDGSRTQSLHLVGSHTGRGTFAPLETDSRRTVEVRSVRGDDVLTDLLPDKITVVKIDVEGHECRALRGLEGVLRGRDVAVIVEVIDRMLRRAGDSADLLHASLGSLGFRSFRIDLAQCRWRKRLVLRPLEGPSPDPEYDALFVRPDCALYRDRVLPLL